MLRTYKESPLNTEILIERLKNRELVISNYSLAEHCLQTNGYHRLSAYFHPFKVRRNNKSIFRSQTNFEDIWNLYKFDGELRLLVTDALEKIEITFRTTLSETMSLRYGSHWYLESVHFRKQYVYSELIQKIHEICKRNDELTIKKYYQCYDHPKFPPSWIIFENLSFGICTNIFRNLKKINDKKEICSVFNYHPTAIESWIESLRYTRNLCAHHSRLWNRWFTICPSMQYLFQEPFNKEHTFYAQAIIIERLLKPLLLDMNWKRRLFDLLERYPKIPVYQMGFYEIWKLDRFWDNKTRN
ncbi:MAG: Abi family protein [Proteobacteria bacterium]|nr:Abi family protein [Pseudomonadota bacterium]